MAAVIVHGSCMDVPSVPVPPKRSPTHYLWAVRIARIYEVFPPLCSICDGQMLDHIGVQAEPRCISPTREPPFVGGL